MRVIPAQVVTDMVAKLCIDANIYISIDIDKALAGAIENESLESAKNILQVCRDNIVCAAREKIPVCQDTGMAVVFADIGQEVFIDGCFENAVNEGVRKGYGEGCLRFSVARDPLRRENTGDNTPAVLHTRLVKGDSLELAVAPKGFGSENMSRLYMLTPSQGREGVKQAVIETVRLAGSNPCPPMILGVGIGSTVEGCMLEAKRGLLRAVGSVNHDPYYAELENELLEAVNDLGIGPQGLGGRTTALAVHISAKPTHIAGLPVAVNVGCHVTRHKTGKL